MMKKIDIILTFLCAIVISFLINDFLKEWGILADFYYHMALWIMVPLFSLACLWISHLIGRKLIFVFQGAKHLLVGAAATVIDLKIFELLIWIFGLIILVNPIISKGISFLFSTFIKYLGNKYWAFQKHEPFGFARGRQENWRKELLHFFFITLLGLIIDVGFFYYFTKILGPQFGASPGIWTKLSVIFAALAAAVWNFLGYKLLVFKK